MGLDAGRPDASAATPPDSLPTDSSSAHGVAGNMAHAGSGGGAMHHNPSANASGGKTSSSDSLTKGGMRAPHSGSRDAALALGPSARRGELHYLVK